MSYEILEYNPVSKFGRAESLEEGLRTKVGGLRIQNPLVEQNNSRTQRYPYSATRLEYIIAVIATAAANFSGETHNT